MNEREPKDHAERRRIIFDRNVNLIIDRHYNKGVSIAATYGRFKEGALSMGECDKLMGLTLLSVESEEMVYGTQEEHLKMKKDLKLLGDALKLTNGGVIFTTDEGNTATH